MACCTRVAVAWLMLSLRRSSPSTWSSTPSQSASTHVQVTLMSGAPTLMTRWMEAASCASRVMSHFSILEACSLTSEPSSAPDCK